MSGFTDDTYGGGNRGDGEWPGTDRTSGSDKRGGGMMEKAKDAVGLGSSDSSRDTTSHSRRGDQNFNESSNNRSGMTDYDNSSNTRSSDYDSNTRSSDYDSNTRSSDYDSSNTRTSGYGDSSNTRSSEYGSSTARTGMGSSGYDDTSSTTTGSGYGSGNTLIDSTLGSTKGYDSFANPNAGARSMDEFTSSTTSGTVVGSRSGLNTSDDSYGSGRDTTTSSSYGTGRDTSDTSYGRDRDTSDTSYGSNTKKSSGLAASAGGDTNTRDLSDRYDATAARDDDFVKGDRKESGRDTYGSSNITTADSYGTGNTGKESFMDKMKDKVGLGKKDDEY